MKEKTAYFPWVRKGLSNEIAEIDQLGDMSGNTSSLVLERPILEVTATYNTYKLNFDAKNDKPLEKSERKRVQFVGPGDILTLRSEIIKKITPAKESADFSRQFYPYIEFWEPDFPWRYTPAQPSNKKKLRPWLALLVCEEEYCNFVKLKDGRIIVTLKIENNTQYQKIFLQPQHAWKTAHAQSDDEPDTLDPKKTTPPHFSRLFALRNLDINNKDIPLDEGKKYCALLVPAFETGRLRGIGVNEEIITKTIAQKHAWEATYEKQKNNPNRPFEFPVYYQWTFVTGGDDFKVLARNLSIADSSKFKADITLNVTNMGEGLDYANFKNKPERKKVGMPAATTIPGYKADDPFPAPNNTKYKNEKQVYDNLKTLLSMSPVFEENQALISNNPIVSQVGKDDPWIVPPVYGAKHIMATSIEESVHSRNIPRTDWLPQLNLDIRNRAAAGLGKKTVQIFQEEFVNRAWKQVEAVQALNHILYSKMASVNVNWAMQTKAMKRLEKKTGKTKEKNKFFVTQMMQDFGSMKNSRTWKRDAEGKLLKDKDGNYIKDDVSLTSLMEGIIPEEFASATFQNLTDQQENLDTTSILETVAGNQQILQNVHKICNLPNKENLTKILNKITEIVAGKIMGNLSLYFKVETTNKTGSNVDQLFNINKKIFNILTTPPEKINDPISAPINHFNFYYRFFNTINTSDYDNSAKYENLMNKMDEFIRKMGNHSYFGSTNAAIFTGSLNIYSTYNFILNFLNIPNVLANGLNVLVINDEEYNKLFGDQHIITRIGGEQGIYFMPKKRLKENLKNLNGAVSLFIHKFPSFYPSECTFSKPQKINMGFTTVDTIYSYVVTTEVPDDGGGLSHYKLYENNELSSDTFRITKKVTHKFITTITATNDSYGLIEDVDYQYCPIRDCYHPLLYRELENLSVFAKNTKWIGGLGSGWSEVPIDGKKISTKIEELTTWISKSPKRKEYDNWKEKVTDYLLNTPDYVVVDAAKVETLTSYYKKYDTMEEYFAFLAGNEFYDSKLSRYLRELTLLKNCIEKELKFPAPPPPQLNPTIDDKKVKDLKSSFLESETWARMEEVATDYYKTFFNNEKLIKDYLNELLASKYPILAYPQFPEPVYYYLKAFSDKFIIPCIDELPDESIALFKSNTAFTEAYMCGMNTEMGRELLWREYPTDQRGSYFRKFWDSETSVKDIEDGNFFDIETVHTWEGNLGDNHKPNKTGLLLFTIKGKLMRLFPSTQVYLHKAIAGATPDTVDFHETADKILPVIQAYLKQDILLVGFKIEFSVALGNPKNNDYGYMLAFREDVKDLNFQGKPESSDDDAAKVANRLKNNPALFGKHISLFI